MRSTHAEVHAEADRFIKGDYMSNGLEHGYYLEMKTGCEHDATVIYIGPYAGRSEAEEESDFLVNTPKGEKMLGVFKVNSIKPIHSSDIDGPVVHALDMYSAGLA